MSSFLDQVWVLIKYFVRFFSDGTVPAKLAPSIGYLVPVIIFFPERRAFGIYFLCIAMNRNDDGHPKRITVD